MKVLPNKMLVIIRYDCYVVEITTIFRVLHRNINKNFTTFQTFSLAILKQKLRKYEINKQSLFKLVSTPKKNGFYL